MKYTLNRRHYLALSLASAVPALQAQSWPSKPVRLVVPFAPGGSTDVIARMLGWRFAPYGGPA